MKLIIYNSYFHAYGGGERYVVALVPHLISMGYEVTLASENNFDLVEYERRMGYNLNAAEKLIFGNISLEQKLDRFSKFDIFINATYFSTIPGRGKKNICIVHFPAIPRKSVFLRRCYYNIGNTLIGKDCDISEITIGTIAENLDNNYVYYSNFSNNSNITLPHSVDKLLLYLSYNAIDLVKRKLLKVISTSKRRLQIDIMDTHIVVTDKGKKFNEIIFEFEKDVGGNLGESSVFENVAIYECTYEGRTLRKIALSCLMKNRITKRLVNKLYLSYRKQVNYFNYKNFYSSYDRIWINSLYSIKWMKKFYSVDNIKLVYPPIETKDFVKGKKENIIISVGRFFVSGHNKKQLEMIQMFKELYKNLGNSSWQYCICGALNENIKEDVEYFELCRDTAKGFPIIIHKNICIKELKALFGKAKIFWHASGLSQDERKRPENLEHFGMTTVEAMSCGAVPIVINRGGQQEIVEDGKCGYKWNEIEECIRITKKLIENSSLMKELSNNAINRAKRYDTKVFLDNAVRQIECLVRTPEKILD